MEEFHLAFPVGYDATTQSAVGHFVAQLDDQMQHFRTAIAGLNVEQLEWQPRPGVNTIGMLLAHCAVAECAWIDVIPTGMPLDPEGGRCIQKILGIRMEDDGLPLSPLGGHPEPLRQRTSDEYWKLLQCARQATHEVTRGWLDSDLDVLHATTRRKVSRRWILNHVLQHHTAHYGQVLLLCHWMRADGVL